jgi:SulP family sulfate permease
LVVYRFGAPLYFANATMFLEEVEELITRSDLPVRGFVLDAESIADIDVTGAETFRQVLDLLDEHGATFAVSRATPKLLARLQHYGLLAQIGHDHIHPTNRHADAACASDAGATRADSGD